MSDQDPPQFNPYSTNDPSMNVPVSTGAAGSIISPYLNFDPSYLNTQHDSQFIFPEGASRTRGRFERSFSQIGACVLLGGAVGGANGLYSGVKDVTTKQLTGANRKTQLLNYITKGGASTAQTLGVLGFMYSVFGVILSSARGVDDEINGVVSGTATGLLYKSSAGVRGCLRGGAIGLGLTTVYALYQARDKLKDFVSS